MKQSPLSLEHCHVTNLSIEPEVGYTSDEGFYPDFSNANFSSRVGIGVPKDNAKSKYALRLALEIEPKSESSFPYSIDIEMEGFFAVVDEKTISDPRNMVLVNGSAVLYGAIREHLLMVTSRFVHGNLMLPTVNFLDLAEEMKEEAEEPKKDSSD